jgi:flagellar motor protein MotB
VVELINTHKLTDSKMVLDSCLQLSQQRADAARKAVLEYARSKNYNLDENQIVAVGVGVLEPLVAVPRSDPEMARNRRVEFRLIRTTTEALTTSGVDI